MNVAETWGTIFPLPSALYLCLLSSLERVSTTEGVGKTAKDLSIQLSLTEEITLEHIIKLREKTLVVDVEKDRRKHISKRRFRLSKRFEPYVKNFLEGSRRLRVESKIEYRIIQIVRRSDEHISIYKLSELLNLPTEDVWNVVHQLEQKAELVFDKRTHEISDRFMQTVYTRRGEDGKRNYDRRTELLDPWLGAVAVIEPSLVGISTVEIPSESDPALNTAPQDPFRYDAFISYSHKDRTWVNDTLLPHLEGERLRVCIDDRDFEIGVPSLVNMENAVDRSRKILLVLTPDWVASEWTKFESLLIQTRDPYGGSRRILPLMVRHCELPPRLQIFTHLDLTDSAELDAQMQRLVTTIRAAMVSS